jgi:hypothetical protein
MEKFSQWLDKTPGAQLTLITALKHHPSGVSLVKHGYRPMPLDWFDLVIRLSGGLFTHEELINARIKTQATLKKKRAAQREALVTGPATADPQ